MLMLKVMRQAVGVASVGVLLLALVPFSPVARANVFSCDAVTDIRSVEAGSVTPVGFTVTNSDDSQIRWMRVIVPSADYQITSTTIAGWNDATSGGSTSTFLTGGVLYPGNSVSFTINVQAPSGPSGPADWVVYASDDSGGAQALACSGTKDFSTVGGSNTTLSMTALMLNSLNTNSVRISWSTNLAAISEVRYGFDTGYGTTRQVSRSPQTSHEITLTGLQPNTLYHFEAFSDSNGQTLSSGDNTFVTADIAAVTSELSSGSANVPGVVILDRPAETEPPSITVGPLSRQSYAEAPEITGEARDNVAVARVDYSTDGGVNWLPVDRVEQVSTGTGRRASSSPAYVRFSFRPGVREDGNYEIVVRATDSSGNQRSSNTFALVLDRIPPRAAALVVAAGVQQVSSGPDGVLTLPIGLEYRVNAKLVGGPVWAQLVLETTGKRRVVALSARDGGLWTGVLAIDRLGKLPVYLEARDGAGNQIRQLLSTLNVVEPLTVLVGGAPARNITAEVRRYDEVEHRWSRWDAEPYGEANPQKTGQSGAVHMLLPSGTYHLHFSRPGALDTVSRTFHIDQPTALSGLLHIDRQAHLSIGSWRIPMPWMEAVTINLANSSDIAPVSGGRWPFTSLERANGTLISTADLLGKPTVLMAATPWASGSTTGMEQIREVATNPDVQAFVYVPGESGVVAGAWMSRAGSDVPILADPDAALSSVTTHIGLPVMYFFDRRGILKTVMVGEHSAEEITAALGRVGRGGN